MAYSRVPNNRRGWNNIGGWGGWGWVDIAIIINNSGRGGVGIIEGLDGVEKIV